MTDLTHLLTRWQKAGLLSADNAEAILAFEKEYKPAKNSWWLYSLIMLGVTTIFLGIASIAAANWSLIPDIAKLGTAFVGLCLLSGALLWQYQQTNHFTYEVLMALFLLGCLSHLFLIAHLYPAGYNWYHYLLFWAMMCLPAVLLTRRFFNHLLWVSLALPAFVWSVMAWVKPDNQSAYQQPDQLLLLLAISSALGYLSFQYYRPLRVLRRGFTFWFPILALLALVLIDLIRSGGEPTDYQLAHYVPIYTGSALLALLIIGNRHYKTLNKGLLLACLLLVLLYFHPSPLFDGNLHYGTTEPQQAASDVLPIFSDDLTAPILTVLILFLFAIHSGTIGHTTLFNTVTFLIGLRFVVFYFQAMGSLAITGVRLIISGLLIIVIAWLWYKSRATLQQWSKRLHQ